MKLDKKGAVIGAFTGAVAAWIGTSTNLNLLETIGVACVVGIAIAVMIQLIWK
jgi:hypothetical protein